MTDVILMKKKNTNGSSNLNLSTIYGGRVARVSHIGAERDVILMMTVSVLKIQPQMEMLQITGTVEHDLSRGMA